MVPLMPAHVAPRCELYPNAFSASLFAWSTCPAGATHSSISCSASVSVLVQVPTFAVRSFSTNTLCFCASNEVLAVSVRRAT